MRTLERLCGHPEIDLILPTVLSEQWEALSEVLRNVPITPPGNLAASLTPGAPRYLAYLVIRLARPARFLSDDEVKFIGTASGHDRTMLRHQLVWAWFVGPTNPGWHFGDSPAPESLWEHEAEVWRRAFAAATKETWTAFDWVLSAPRSDR